MPRLSAWMVRLSLVALVAGATIGALLLGGIPAAVRQAGALRAVHITLMLFGWLVQFVLGVAYWILPRQAVAPERGPVSLAWLAFGTFQAGVGLVLVGAAAPSVGVLAPAGQLLLAGATLLFLVLLVPRIKPFGSG
jgi:cbb3-type cytochrome oxidase subunit 1